MSGVKGRSGPRRKSLNRANAQRRMTQLLPSAIETIEETINGKNTERLPYEAAVEVKNSCMGKPVQQTDIHIPGGGALEVALAVKVFTALTEQKKLTEGRDATEQAEE